MDVKNNQERFKSNLGEMERAHWIKSNEEKDFLYNIEMLDKARNKAIKFHDNYSLMVSDAKIKAIKETTWTGLNNS